MRQDTVKALCESELAVVPPFSHSGHSIETATYLKISPCIHADLKKRKWIIFRLSIFPKRRNSKLKRFYLSNKTGLYEILRAKRNHRFVRETALDYFFVFCKGILYIAYKCNLLSLSSPLFLSFPSYIFVSIPV